MMMAGDHHQSPNYHLARINQPDMKEAPAKRLPTGASSLGVPSDQAGVGRNRLRQGPKPSVNVASHLVFGNAVAFLDFAF